MKNFIKILSISFIFTLFIVSSCSKEKDDVEIENKSMVDLEKTKIESTEGWITFDGSTIVSKQNKLVCFDKKNIFTHFVKDINEIQFEVENNANGFTLTNSFHQNEKVYVTKISDLNSVITYDVVGSNGKKLSNIKFFNKSGSTVSFRCPACVVVIGSMLINAIFPPESPCATAARECRLSGGLPSSTITEHWYGGSTCEVSCAPKPN